MKATAVVPTYNEEDTIRQTVTSLRAVEGVQRVVVVDDASSDGSAAAAMEAGADVVINGTNLGKGGSLNRVLAGLDFEVLLLIDGDLGDHASQARKVLAPVLSGESDLAIAAFPGPALKGGLGLAQGTARAGIKLLTGLDMSSPLSGQRAMRREVFEAVRPFREGFGVETAMTIDAHRAGFRITEVHTEMGHKETGRDLRGFVHRGKQFLDIIRALASRVF